MDFIELLRYMFLGFVQGLTETIPVSSSGHLAIIRKIIELDVDFDTLAILTNFGSLIAIVIFFRKDLANLIKSFFGYLTTKKDEYKEDYRYCWLVALGCIPAGTVGLIFSKYGILETISDNLKFIGGALILTAILLFIIRDFKGDRSDGNITVKNALIIGLFQVAALIPGISRSGSTIVGGLSQNLKRDSAFKYSFMMYIPLSLAAMGLEVSKLIDSNITLDLWIYYIFAIIVAAVVTYIATLWFRAIIHKGKLIYFSIYCVIVGSIVLIFS